ncbi:hypothetical protein M8C21_007654, partial [Ambrosia artemisiifolia]
FVREMDRISQLPDSVVHHILSFVNTRPDLVRMSVLSKTWFHLTASFPILNFNIRKFRSRESFFKYVEYTTSRFCHHSIIPAHKLKLKLKLCATILVPAELDIVNRCLQLLLNKGVKVLVIDVTNSSESPKYRLPNILLSVSMLESLTICGCDLSSSFMLDALRFKSLIKLKLEYVPLDVEVIKYLATSCPLLQQFHIGCCSGLNRVCLYGHQNLQTLLIYYDTPLERIDVEAPNLSSLVIIDEEESGAPRMNLASCKKLTSVAYMGHPLPNSNGFTNFLSYFPFIENFYLATTYNCKNFKLSSRSLRTLMLHSVCDFELSEFNTPNLVLFAYPCDVSSFLPMVRNSTRPTTHLKPSMQCYPDDSIDALWFQKLRLLLNNKNGFKVLNLYIHTIHSQKFTDIEKLKAIELPPYELEHVELQLDT